MDSGELRSSSADVNDSSNPASEVAARGESKGSGKGTTGCNDGVKSTSDPVSKKKGRCSCVNFGGT